MYSIIFFCGIKNYIYYLNYAFYHALLLRQVRKDFTTLEIISNNNYTKGIAIPSSFQIFSVDISNIRL